MTSPIAITGVTGVMGRQVADILASKSLPLRLLVRGGASRSPAIDNADVVDFEGYHDKQSCANALKGCDICFMVSGREDPDRLEQHYTFIDAAVDAGVKHIVYTSFMGAAPDAAFHLARQHFHTEQYIKTKQVNYTFLRNNFYQDAMIHFVLEDNTIRGPAGKGKTSPVARNDLSAVAATVLADPFAHENKTYTLTGPEEYDLGQIAAMISEHQNKKVAYIDETMEEAKISRSGSGAEDWLIDAWISTYTAIKVGELGGISSDLESITGRKPTSFNDLLAHLR